MLEQVGVPILSKRISMRSLDKIASSGRQMITGKRMERYLEEE
jgi:hypothetical protein